MGKEIRCEGCGEVVAQDDEWIILTKSDRMGFYRLCSDCFDHRATKDVRKCPRCWEWHDDEVSCPRCGEPSRDVNEVIHER